ARAPGRAPACQWHGPIDAGALGRARDLPGRTPYFWNNRKSRRQGGTRRTIRPMRHTYWQNLRGRLVFAANADQARNPTTNARSLARALRGGDLFSIFVPWNSGGENRMRRLIFGTIIGSLAAIAAVAAAIYYYERPSVLRIAVVRSDLAMPPNGQTVLIMRRDAALLFAPAESSLRAIDDLRGHKVGVLQAAPPGKVDNQLLLDTALAQYDVPSASVGRVSLTLAELSRAVENKEIDAVLAVGVPGSDGLTEAVKPVAVGGHGQRVFLPIAEAKAIAQRSPAFEGIEVMRGAFGGAQPKPPVDFDTLGVSTRLVARNSLGNEVAGALTRLLLAAPAAIAARIPIANRIEAPAADKGAALPVHPGALAFLDDEEESFFDKYSDAFYIVAMCLGALGTELAAIAGRFTRHQSTDADKILRRLLEIAMAARSARHVGLLDGYEEEADELLAR